MIVVSDDRLLAPVSVVIPAYNCAAWIAEALDSVLLQTVPPRQIIVVDDGSSDQTPDVVRPYVGRVQYVHQENRGVSAARNRGIHAAREEFVAFLDADDVWHPRKLELQLRAFERRPELGILSCPTYRWPGGALPELAPEPALPVRPVRWEQVVVRNRLNTSAVMVRREVLRRAGPFDRGLHGPEDRDLWLRVLEIAPGATLEIPLSGYRITPAGISRDADRCRQGMLRILAKLDARRAWRGRWLLRRRAYAYLNHSCAYLYTAQRRQGRALACALRSLAWYPWPLGAGEAEAPLERPRRAAVVALRWLGLKSPDALSAAAPATSSVARPGALGDLQPAGAHA
jgi:glycosyltransferase involved in cell wall biosynthesis